VVSARERICFLCTVNVVILHQYFNTPQTGGPLRSWFLAHALLQNGHKVVVITTTQSGRAYRETVEGIDVHYLPVAYDNSFGFYRRAMSFCRYAFRAYRIASMLPGINLCYAISVPLTVGIPAMLLKAFHNIPFVFEVGDLWPDAPIELGYVKNPILRFLLLWFEKTIYRSARAIVALSEPIKKRIAVKVPGKIIDVIPNMADTEYLKPRVRSAGAFSESAPFVISYIGAIGFANGVDHILECARACQKASLPVRFVICGEGAFSRTLQDVSNRLNISNLSFLEFQSRDGVRKLLDESDAVFVSYRPFPILETGSPNKYFDGLAAGKLIIVNFGGWIKNEVEENACGFFISTQRPHEIVNALTSYLNEPTLLDSAQTNARNLAVKKYSRRVLSQQFADIIARK
jgi:glycosyltransferase involved in cell wall biosynthesis